MSHRVGHSWSDLAAAAAKLNGPKVTFLLVLNIKNPNKSSLFSLYVCVCVCVCVYDLKKLHWGAWPAIIWGNS